MSTVLAIDPGNHPVGLLHRRLGQPAPHQFGKLDNQAMLDTSLPPAPLRPRRD